MLKWISSFTQKSDKREWLVSIDGNIQLFLPRVLSRDSQFDAWGKIQATTISRFREHWPNTHVYIKFTADTPWKGTDILESSQCEKIGTIQDQIYLLPDCEDHSIFENALAYCGYESSHLGRSIFVLDYQPADSQQTITKLFEIIKKLTFGLGQHITKFENDLSGCRCLCYSEGDERLIIAKVDLPENIVVSILEDIARENGMELVIKRKSERTPRHSSADNNQRQDGPLLRY